MEKCWANSLGDCEEGISREHLISESFFSAPLVRVQGLHWCKHEPKVVGISAATSKILCKKHNSALSPLDSAIGKFMHAIGEHLALSEARSKLNPTPLKVVRFAVQGRLIERWLLKSLLNLLTDGPLQIGETGTVPGKPPLDLVEIAYGLRTFEGSAGMYVASHVGLAMEMGEHLEFSPILQNNERALGGLFKVGGVFMLLCLNKSGLPPLHTLQGIDPQWAASSLRRPFRKIVAKHGKYISHVIEFKW